MKKIILIFLMGLSITSCINEDVNNDPNSVYNTLAETTVSYAQKELSDYMNTPSVNENNFRLTMQYWQETTYVNESIYDFTNRNVSNNVWSDNYVNILNNLSKSKELINSFVPAPADVAGWPAKKRNELAIIDIMMVYVYQNMVDTFGNIPYSQSLNLVTYPLPVYDDANTIYQNLIVRLSGDIANLGSGASFGSTELFYAGDVSKWKKFGNSLLLKLGIALSDANAALAQTTVNQAISGGVMTSTTDTCQLQYLIDSPNYSPLYDNLVASGRDDFYGAAPLIDFMNLKSDARISAYYDPQGTGTTFIGSPIGVAGDFGDYSHIGAFAYTETTPGTILSYTEVAFYLAEAAARFTPTLAPAAYNNAVSASFNEWGAGASTAAYLTANPYDTSNWKKSIGEQAWVAMYNQANTAWNFYRRLDFPVLLAPSNAIPASGGKIPVRLLYPTKEATTNSNNWSAAGAAIGGDKLTTKIFWDKF